MREEIEEGITDMPAALAKAKEGCKQGIEKDCKEAEALEKYMYHMEENVQQQPSRAQELKEAITKIANAKRIFLNNKRIK